LKKHPSKATFTLLALCLVVPLLFSDQSCRAQGQASAEALWKSANQNMLRKKTRSLALSQIDEALKLQPDNPGMNWTKAAILASMDEYEDALPCIEKTLKLDPKNARVWNLKAETLHNLKRNTEALACTETAASFFGKPLNNCTKVNILIGMHRFAEAEKEADRLIAPHPQDIAFHGRRADIFIYTSQWDKAVADLTYLINGTKNEKSSLCTLLGKRAECYVKLKHYKKAVADLKWALNMHPDDRNLRALLINVYNLTGDTVAAKAEEKLLNSLDTDHRLYK